MSSGQRIRSAHGVGGGLHGPPAGEQRQRPPLGRLDQRDQLVVHGLSRNRRGGGRADAAGSTGGPARRSRTGCPRRAGRRSRPAAPAVRRGGAGWWRWSAPRSAPPPGPTASRWNAAPTSRGATRRTGACSGPSTQATWLSGRSSTMIEVAEQMAGRLLGPQVPGPRPGSTSAASAPPPAAARTARRISAGDAADPFAVPRPAAPACPRRGAGAATTRDAAVRHVDQDRGRVLDRHRGRRVVQQGAAVAGQGLEAGRRRSRSRTRPRRCPPARGPRRRPPGRGRGAARLRWRARSRTGGC